MAMTFKQLQDAVLHHIGGMDTAIREKIKRWLNDARNTIWEQVPGEYKDQTDYFATTTAYSSTSAITVLGTNGSTTITSDGSTDTVFTSAMIGRFIKVNGGDPWYRIASVTSVTEIELEDAYLGTTFTEGAFSVETYLWPGASDIQSLIQVVIESDERLAPLTIVDRLEPFRQYSQPLEYGTYVPDYAWVDEKDANGLYQIGIWPVPSEATLIRYRYRQDLTEMSADSDTVGIPGADFCIKAGALVEAYSFKDKIRSAQLWDQKYERELERLLGTVTRSTGAVFRADDLSDAGRHSKVSNLGTDYPA